VRIDVPGSDGAQAHWIELRDVTRLTGGDEEAWGGELEDAWDEKAIEDYSLPEGAPPAPLRVKPGWRKRRIDRLLASLITDWSYDKPDADPQVALPFSGDARRALPRTALQALADALNPYIAALEEKPGPKEQETPASTTDGSGSSSD